MGDGSQNDDEDVDLAQYQCQCGGMALLSIERFFQLDVSPLSDFKCSVTESHGLFILTIIALNIINISHHPAPLQSLFPSISKMSPI